MKEAQSAHEIRQVGAKLRGQIIKRYSRDGLSWAEVARLERQSLIATENDIRRFEAGYTVALPS